jgi:hypothetical protein
MKIISAIACACTFTMSACLPSSPDPNIQIQIAVLQTVAAIPTYTPYPRPPVPPTPTSLNLSGLFCEYQFCIGHPPEIAFYDISAVQNQTAPSTFAKGNLAGYNIPNLLILLLWQVNQSNTTNPQFMLDLILSDGLGTRSGALGAQLIGDLNVTFVPITTTTNLPNGVAAAWICGGRAFAWKALTQGPDIAKNLLLDALRRFQCNKA